MNKIFRLLLLSLLLTGAGPAALHAQNKCFEKASAADVQQLRFLLGQWQGQVTEQGATRTLQLHFFERDGQIMATALQAGALVPLTLQASLCAPGKFHFFGLGPHGEDFRFNARQLNEGLSGTFTAGSSCGTSNKPTFALRRTPAVAH
ncbi:hypothetical protein [Hymenobacter sp. CRA2]|uniref:hypothetical protein n=1 Tax=Hymenobacter sp. CRA2 TaxID=1955620 RepID=UPI00098F4A84|nr:hypothetical protein [Hymenobacter sp. CRA2]OON71115.1 hypothetical protein B0919_03755 [Hymenobacter sp. CRA2]